MIVHCQVVDGRRAMAHSQGHNGIGPLPRLVSRRLVHASAQPGAQASTSDAEQVQAAAASRLQHILDGPDLHLMSYPNLGEIGGMLERDSELSAADAQAMLDAPGKPYSPSGLYFDGPAVFGSLTLLTLMLVLSFGRVLGFDQWWAKKLKQYKERRRDAERWRIIEARQRLQQQFDDKD